MNKKESGFGYIFVYVIMLVLAFIFVFTYLRNYQPESGLDSLMFILLVAGGVFGGLLLNAILFELAHMLGAKVGRYQILSVNILGLMFKKVDGKLKIKTHSHDGFTGETKILPKEDAKKEPNPTPYLLFGSLFYAFEIILGVVAFTLLSMSSDKMLKNIGCFILIVIVVGGFILFYNLIPMRLDSINDGYRLTMASNAKNKIAFNELLRAEHALEEGLDVEIKTFDQITNFTADLNLNKVYFLLDKGEFEEATKLLDMILNAEHDVSPKTYLRAKAQKIYIRFMHEDLESATEFYNKEVSVSERREISNDVSMASIRAYILTAGLVDKSKSECIRTLNNAIKAYKQTPKNRQKSELNLFNAAVKKVAEVHKDWELEDYMMVEKDK